MAEGLTAKKPHLTRFLSILGILCLLCLLWSKYRYVLNSQRLHDASKYPSELSAIALTKKKLYKKKAGKKELEKAFIHLISNKVFPYWYGTNWDYNGTTETPQCGNIACGYFVTTVLRDMGVSIHRNKMAQCASEEMIRSLVAKKNIFHLSGLNIEAFEKKVRKLGKGLYVIGLDSHTGFIINSAEGCFMIHASGLYPFQVVKEKVFEAEVLCRSKYRVLGKLSGDEEFLKAWVGYK